MEYDIFQNLHITLVQVMRLYITLRECSDVFHIRANYKN